jgi:hypothetical protein
MASVVDSFSLKFEETARPQGATTTTPYQVSTVRRDMKAKSIGFDPAVQLLERMDEITGTEDEPPALVGGYQPAGTLTHNAYPDDLIFLLALSGWKGTYTAGDGIITDPDGATIPAGAARWVFAKRGGNIPKTAQMDAVYSDELQWLRLQGAGITQLGMNMDGELSATLAALVFLRLTTDPNIAPSLPASSIEWFRRLNLTVPTWLSGHGVTNDFSWQTTNPLDMIKTPAVQSRFPDTALNAAERVALTGTMGARTLTAADIDALVAASSFAAKVKWLSDILIGATAAKFALWLEMPNVQITGGSIDPLTQSRQFGSTLNWRARLDDATGISAKFTIVGSVVSVASTGIGN